MECRSLFSATVTLVSGLEKLHTQQIAYIIYGSSSIFGMKMHFFSHVWFLDKFQIATLESKDIATG